MKKLLVEGNPEPRGHYTPAVEAAGLVFASGILPIDYKTGSAVHGSFAEQLDKLFENISDLLASSGCSKADVVRVGAYVSSIALWDEFNAAYSSFFGQHKPARTILPLGGKLHYGLDVEMDFVAERRG